MITAKEKSIIRKISSRYRARKVLLFGSSVRKDQGRARDIDLAVSGVHRSDFFKFYGELLFSLSRPVDLVDLTRSSKFSRLVEKEGIRIYGKPD